MFPTLRPRAAKHLSWSTTMLPQQCVLDLRTQADKNVSATMFPCLRRHLKSLNENLALKFHWILLAKNRFFGNSNFFPLKGFLENLSSPDSDNFERSKVDTKSEVKLSIVYNCGAVCMNMSLPIFMKVVSPTVNLFEIACKSRSTRNSCVAS